MRTRSTGDLNFFEIEVSSPDGVRCEIAISFSLDAELIRPSEELQNDGTGPRWKAPHDAPERRMNIFEIASRILLHRIEIPS